jgi:hypothetical protein
MASMISSNNKRLRLKDNESIEKTSERKRTTVASTTGIQDELMTSLLNRRKELSNISTAPIDASILLLESEIKQSIGKRWLIRNVLDKRESRASTKHN